MSQITAAVAALFLFISSALSAPQQVKPQVVTPITYPIVIPLPTPTPTPAPPTVCHPPKGSKDPCDSGGVMPGL